MHSHVHFQCKNRKSKSPEALKFYQCTFNSRLRIQFISSIMILKSVLQQRKTLRPLLNGLKFRFSLCMKWKWKCFIWMFECLSLLFLIKWLRESIVTRNIGRGHLLLLCNIVQYGLRHQILIKSMDTIGWIFYYCLFDAKMYLCIPSCQVPAGRLFQKYPR